MLYHAEEQPNHTSSWRCTLPDLQRFSKLEKLRAVQLRVLNFLRNIIKKVRLDGGLDLQKTLLLKRGNEMDVIFIRICQEEEFYSEITCLRYHHLHNEIVVNELRQRYWVCGLRALVREVSNTCPACRIRRARPKPPGMGDLPIERLSPYTPPFTYTGVDYFGPYDIVVGRRREKRWGVLFTCLTVRAVHLDIATSLSTDSYLCVLKSFVARRGCPRRMLSDNGPNFRGSSRVLKDGIERISPALIERQYPELEFTFIPPGSPHMGGSWERMVLSTRSSGLREEVIQAYYVGEDYGSKSELAWHEASESPVNWLTNFGRDGCAIDDIVIIVDDGAKRNCWTRGVAVDVHSSKDGQVRSAVVRTA
ncbi:uncharacterized protein [Drosophila virilis]|uniref:uncharacterized protein n=1 Tax=Drosophila virilis TaxID=7244 RepID=UPI0038B25389